MTADLRDYEPCSHPGCLSHVTHPCEGCGRIAALCAQVEREYWDHGNVGTVPLREMARALAARLAEPSAPAATYEDGLHAAPVGLRCRYCGKAVAWNGVSEWLDAERSAFCSLQGSHHAPAQTTTQVERDYFRAWRVVTEMLEHREEELAFVKGALDTFRLAEPAVQVAAQVEPSDEDVARAYQDIVQCTYASAVGAVRAVNAAREKARTP